MQGLDERALATVLREVLAGVAYLHGRGIVHRDIKVPPPLPPVRQSGATVWGMEADRMLHSAPASPSLCGLLQVRVSSRAWLGGCRREPACRCQRVRV